MKRVNSSAMCGIANDVWSNAYLISTVQNKFAPVGYLRDHSSFVNYEMYLQFNNYLKYVNNELDHSLYS